MINQKQQVSIDLLREIANLQMFSISKDFDPEVEGKSDKQEEKITAEVKSLQVHRRSIPRLLHRLTHYLWRELILSHQKTPFLEVPRHYIYSISPSPDLLPYIPLPSSPPLENPNQFFRLDIGYRTYPGQTEMLYQEIMLPESNSRLSFLYNNLGISYISNPISPKCLFSYTYAGVGCRDFISPPVHQFPKIILDLCSFYNGMYGRFLVLVTLGIGCIVWYGMIPGAVDQAPLDSILFSSFESYEPFMDMDYHRPLFKKVSFLELYDTADEVKSAFETEHPLTEINIPANGEILKAVRLGLMVAIFIAVGIVPNLSGDTTMI